MGLCLYNPTPDPAASSQPPCGGEIVGHEYPAKYAFHNITGHIPARVVVLRTRFSTLQFVYPFTSTPFTFTSHRVLYLIDYPCCPRNSAKDSQISSTTRRKPIYTYHRWPIRIEGGTRASCATYGRAFFVMLGRVYSTPVIATAIKTSLSLLASYSSWETL